MIPIETQRKTISAMARAIGLRHRRADQDHVAPKTPYILWKQIQNQTEAQQTAYKQNHPTPTGDVQTKTHKHANANISVTLIGKKYDQLWEEAQNAIDWLDSDGALEANQKGLTLTIISQPQDRTAFKETAHEYRIGFDIRLDGMRITTQQTPALDPTEAIGA